MSKTNNIIKGTTKRGYKFQIDKRILKDYRFIELIGPLNSKDSDEQVSNVTKLVDLIFNDKKKKEEFLQFLADEDGFVDAETVINELADIILKLGDESKN